MRNLEILTKFTNTLKELQKEEKVVAACLDEFGSLLFVLTTSNILITYSFEVDNPVALTCKSKVTLTDEIPIDPVSYTHLTLPTNREV